MHRRFARLSAGLAFALAAGTVTAVMAAPVGAATPLQTCKTVKGSATFTPGLTNTPRDNVVKAKGTQTGCTPSAKTGGSGVLTATIKVLKGSCLKLAQGKQTIKGTAATTWHNKKVSKYSLTLKTGSGSTATTATITGKVTSGLFAGHAVTGAVKFTVSGTPNCTTKPVKGATFKSVKPFVIH
jgi:hypothetical protein